MIMANKVEVACENNWEDKKNNCSGFVKAVAAELGVSLDGDANTIVEAIQKLPWTTLKEGKEAKAKAESGFLVVAGLKAPGNGHVAIITPGQLAHEKYPVGYWGKLNGIGKKATAINWSWNKTDRDNVIYSYIVIK
jgi:hypothetical protein